MNHQEETKDDTKDLTESIIEQDILANKFAKLNIYDVHQGSSHEKHDSSNSCSSPDNTTSTCSGKKRHRSYMNEEQYRRFASVFTKNSNPSPEQIQELSIEQDLDYKKVKLWFKNQRALKKKRK